MRILHVSDSHGLPPSCPDEDFDVIVHSGDFCPNRSFANKTLEVPFQTYWCENTLSWLHPKYWTVPVVITPGNHDYIDVAFQMREIGIDARLACDNFVDVDGISFWGHPWTPEFFGWNWMCDREEMRKRLARAAELLEQGGVDVFVSHGPMWGIFDRNREGKHCGCPELGRVLEFARHTPKALLHGHIHEANNVVQLDEEWDGMIISNAALGQRIVEIS